jgi:hypothetical protein
MCLCACLLALNLTAQVTKVEAGHTLQKIVDSANPIHPSQSLLTSTLPQGTVESIGLDPAGNIYVQVGSFTGGPYKSATTHIFKITPGGVVTVLAANTGFGINNRGTDLIYHPATAQLLTQDQNNNRIASVDPGTGTIASHAPFDFSPSLGTFGAAIAGGIGIVPPGYLAFVSDTIATGLYSTPFGGPAVKHATPPTPGDDIVIQPDGDWVHAPDTSGGPLAAYNPTTFARTDSATGLNVRGMFLGAGLPFVFGTRLAGCSNTGEMYATYSGGPGGPAVFRVNEPLTTATMVAQITPPYNKGIQDIAFGKATSGWGNSVYMTVNRGDAGNAVEVWELTAPCGTVLIDLKPGSNPNCVQPAGGGSAPVSILGSGTFNAATVNPETVYFGGAKAARCSLEDVNLDGYMDLSCKFETRSILWPAAGKDCGVVALTAQTFSGQWIEGVDIACLAGGNACNLSTPTPAP